MKIEVERIKENEDGSADCVINMDKEGTDFIVRYGIVSAIKDAVDIAKANYTPRVYGKDMQISDMEYMKDLVDKQDRLLQDQAILIERLRKEPLSDERIRALYRRTMDWRQFARDIEEEHGVGL